MAGIADPNWQPAPIAGNNIANTVQNNSGSFGTYWPSSGWRSDPETINASEDMHKIMPPEKVKGVINKLTKLGIVPPCCHSINVNIDTDGIVKINYGCYLPDGIGQELLKAITVERILK